MVNQSIHLTGAGIVGCVLMHRLADVGIPFTWSDVEVYPVAWRACTGSGPAGDAEINLKPAWQRFANSIDDSLTEYVDYYRWNHKESKWIHDGKSWHLNAQQFIALTRKLFNEFQRQEPDIVQREIKTVGAMTCKEWWWGWSVIATADINPRSCWSKRVVRQSRYLYPRPGGNDFYAGSTIMFQKTPKVMDTDKHLHWWIKDFADFIVANKIEVISSPIQGWRPVGTPGQWSVDEFDNIVIAPMSASGVKYSPMLAEEITNYLLGEK